MFLVVLGYLPNIHTSDAVVNLLKLIDSGAIHLMGSLPLVAEINNTISYKLDIA